MNRGKFKSLKYSRVRVSLYIIRGLFFLISCGAGFFVVECLASPEKVQALRFTGIICGAIFGAIIIIAEIFFSKSDVSTISAVVFGVIAGFVTAQIFSKIVLLFNPNIQSNMAHVIETILTIIFCYLGITLLLRTQDQFRFIIPYVEFKKKVRGARPLILDTSVIIDGRIKEVASIGIFDCELIVPEFVLKELQDIADSSDKNKRERGRRGLDILQEIERESPSLFSIKSFEAHQAKDVDIALVELAKGQEARIITNDTNLSRIARLEGVDVININELVEALRQIVIAGEEIDVKILRRGEEKNQGIGFLNDGTMVVVEGARDKIGRTITIEVTSVHQSSVGRMIFGEIK